jgi:hypothetical protein
MVADDGPRQTIRRNMKYERIAPTLIYSKLQRAVASYLASPIRDRKILERCREEIADEALNATSPKARENATYALRALETFERSLNALPIAGINLSLAPLYRAHVVGGVKVSIQPTALISVNRPRGKPLRGAIIIDTAKGIEPKTEEAKARAQTAMVHSAYMLHEHVSQSVTSDDEKSSSDYCMVFHTHRQELVKSPANYRSMLRNLEAACQDISVAWEAIDPPPSFDRLRARFRD